MSAELHPRGVYKLFNPAICTLPPKYTEPAIKLVGTLAVLYGSAAYERMSEAEHTAMVVSTVGTDEEIARLAGAPRKKRHGRPALRRLPGGHGLPGC